MEIYFMDPSQILPRGATINAGDLYQMATANMIPSAKNAMTVYLTQRVAGSTLFPSSQEYGGNSQPAVGVSPTYFPFATAGSECAALISDLSWAHNNLELGFEYILCDDTAGALSYFVTGVLTSSETEFNDPFEPLGTKNGAVVIASCWASSFAPGLNPF
jgi:hypothetical protein